MFGPSDFTDDSANNLSHEAGILFGVKQADKDMLKLASPVTYITPDDPPILILHGDKDSTVDLKQSELFFNALAAAGVHTELVIVQDGEHGFVPVGVDFTIPTRGQITQIMIEFFDKYLKAP